MPVILPKPWSVPATQITDKADWLDRRQILKALGLAGIGPSMLVGCEARASAVPKSYAYKLPSYTTNTTWPVSRPVTDEEVTASYNNFYEFTPNKARVYQLARDLDVKPWRVEVTGEVAKPKTYSVAKLLKKMPLEERTYRFRCVEAWSMTVPWIGFPLRELLWEANPLGNARWVRLVSLHDPEQMPGQKETSYPWPYYEGLSMNEAMHDLTLMAVGIYGHPLPNQNGAPIRLVVPWKYGYKSIKSVVKIEVLAEKPKTFWNDLVPGEYDFDGNVRPDIPHPRWSQATERVIPTGERIPTLPYNGYAEWVKLMYKS